MERGVLQLCLSIELRNLSGWEEAGLGEPWVRPLRTTKTWLSFLCRCACLCARVSYGDEGLADRGEDVGSQRVQQQLVFGEDGEQQRAGVLRAEVLQQLQEAGAAGTKPHTERLNTSRSSTGLWRPSTETENGIFVVL